MSEIPAYKCDRCGEIHVGPFENLEERPSKIPGIGDTCCLPCRERHRAFSLGSNDLMELAAVESFLKTHEKPEAATGEATGPTQT